MGATQTSNINDRLFAAAGAARGNPYIQKVLHDEELRNSAIDAFKSARNAFDRAHTKNFDRNKLANDKKLRKELESAFNGLKQARAGFTAAPKRRRGFRKLLGLLLIGGGIAIAVNEDIRKSVLGKLFGGESEVKYASPTSTNGAS